MQDWRDRHDQKGMRPSEQGDPKPYTGQRTHLNPTEEMIQAKAREVEAEMVRMERKTLRDMGMDDSGVLTIEDVWYH